ncbi:MAG: FAD-dependent oxidoreductase [Myxococcales bacterium]
MARPRSARLVDAASLSRHARLLTFEVVGEALGFVGGQYLIFDTGLVRKDGKAVKRAYSLLSADDEQHRFQIAVQRLPQGPGSGFFHTVQAGAELAFSGPWGKFLPDDARPRPTLLVATDSGITAALGLARGGAFAPQRARSHLLWLCDPAAGFLPEELVRAACAELAVEAAIEILPPPGHPERIAAARTAVQRTLAARRPESVFLSGDGAVLYPLRDDLAAAGVDAAAARLEAFFNNPQRKVPA